MNPSVTRSAPRNRPRAPMNPEDRGGMGEASEQCRSGVPAAFAGNQLAPAAMWTRPDTGSSPVSYTSIRDAHQQAQTAAAGAVNRHLILRNWLIGAYLVEFEQNGEARAEYGARLIQRVASDLKSRAITGLGAGMLKGCRTFYRLYPQIRQPAVGESFAANIAANATYELPPSLCMDNLSAPPRS